MDGIGILGLGIGLGLLIYLSFKGWSMIPTSIAASLAVIITNRMNLWEAFSVSYATSMKNYAGTYLLLFFLGTVFGGLMGESGAAKSIAVKLLNTLGSGKGLLIVVLVSGILSYGGINLFVLLFTIYPIALVLFNNENIPKRLFPAAMLLGSATFSMVGLPGSPAIQNLIPCAALGTNAYAAPLNGTLVSIVMFALGMVFLVRQQKRLAVAGIGFVPGSRDDLNKIRISEDDDLPHWALSLLPMAVLILFIFFTRNTLDTVYAVNIALSIGIAMVLCLFWKRIENPLKSINESAANSITALLNTSVIVGFGGVVQASSGFASVVDFALSMAMSPLISASLATGIVSAATGSCSGGLQIFLDFLGPKYIELCQAAGIPLEVLHRVICLAGAGLDTLPHSGGFITAIVYTQLTAKESYKYVFFTNIVVTSIGCVVSILLFMALGII